DLTCEKFIPDPFSMEPGKRMYRTGDVARYVGGDGELEYVGRKDHQVKVRGFRIELGEIESMLGRHPGVENSVAIVVDDAFGERRVAACVVAKVGLTLTGSELREYLRSRAPEYMVPSSFVMLESI